jgi:hypothetical protein
MMQNEFRARTLLKKPSYTISRPVRSKASLKQRTVTRGEPRGRCRTGTHNRPRTNEDDPANYEPEKITLAGFVKRIEFRQSHIFRILGKGWYLPRAYFSACHPNSRFFMTIAIDLNSQTQYRYFMKLDFHRSNLPNHS